MPGPGPGWLWLLLEAVVSQAPDLFFRAKSPSLFNPVSDSSRLLERRRSAGGYGWGAGERPVLLSWPCWRGSWEQSAPPSVILGMEGGKALWRQLLGTCLPAERSAGCVPWAGESDTQLKTSLVGRAVGPAVTGCRGPAALGMWSAAVHRELPVIA